jgi:hypothetical protein
MDTFQALKFKVIFIFKPIKYWPPGVKYAGCGFNFKFVNKSRNTKIHTSLSQV